MNDGSSDDSEEIAQEYVDSYPDRIFLLSTEKPRGLRACANDAIEKARGRFIMRLDADDYLDSNALLVLVHYLEENPDVGLVYPNWTYVGEEGEFLGIEKRKVVGKEAKVLDLPAHGACTMVRRRILKSIGGYDLSHDSQDGHELWLKVLERNQVGNVETPLFYYRQHGSSMSRNEKRLLSARQKIKRSMASRSEGSVAPRIVAIVPVRNQSPGMSGIALERVSGKPLIDYTLDVACGCSFFDHVYVTTDDQRIVEHCSSKDGVIAETRDTRLSTANTKLADVLVAAVDRLETVHDIHPDIIVLLSIHSPLRREEHIQEAIDTLSLYKVDNVISTYEDLDLHFQHGENGLTPLNVGAIQQLRYEREALFVDNGAVHAFWRDFVSMEHLYKGRVGHIVMTREDSFQIKKLADLDMLGDLLSSGYADKASTKNFKG